ncbi:MAG: tRNA pseudouridine(55) synthase TruB [Anaerolineae bacterium]|nr:tRNA pseudouridine(55) synthase TruB [Anaerolineae bacterium]
MHDLIEPCGNGSRLKMLGLLNINKPSGMTSHDVVNAVRRITGLRQVGHTGTLDPLATGVLIVLVGAATRLARYLSGADKTYTAVVRLGETTSTYDAEGEILLRRPVTVGRAEIEAALGAYRGPLLQTPPMVSALKVGGKPLYKLARQGQEIERQPRLVTIHALTLDAWALPEFTLSVTCSAGTYIRSLAHDLGEQLGCGAHLVALTRTATGRFDLGESVTLEQLRALAEAGRLAEALLPPDVAVMALPGVTLTPAMESAVRYGQSIELPDAPVAAEVRAHDVDGHLVAMLMPLEDGRWRPTLVLPALS